MKSKIFTIILILVVVLVSIDLAYSREKINKSSYQIAKEKYKWINKELYIRIDKYALKRNLSTLLICALIQRESHGKQYAKSCKGAKGLMQLMPCHYKEYKNKEIVYNIDFNLNKGTGYLRYCVNLSKNKLDDALRRYNQGHNADPEEYKNWKYVEDIKTDFKDSLVQRYIER